MSKKRDKYQAVIGITLLILISLSPEVAVAEDEESPSLELLEFLGEWETQDGQWVDPLNLLEVAEIVSDNGEEAQDDE